MSDPKEVHFFEDNFGDGPNLNFEKGWSWVATGLLSHYDGERVVGEASPSYSVRDLAPSTWRDRIHEFSPVMKIVYMVRHPLERQISEWRMQWATDGIDGVWPNRQGPKWALKGLDYWMQKEKRGQRVGWMLYAHYQLAAFQAYFSSGQICVSFLE